MKLEKFIVACINGSSPSDSVIDHSVWMSHLTHNRIKLFHTLDQQYSTESGDLSGTLGMDTQDELLHQLVEIEHNQNKLLKRKGELILKSAKKRIEDKIPNDPKLCLRYGRLIENMLEIKDQIGCLVIGKYGKSHQGPLSDCVVGHKVESVIRSLEKPILVVNNDFTPPQKILVAIDDSPNSLKILDFLNSHEGLKSVELHLVNVSDDPNRSKALLKKNQRNLEIAGLNVQTAQLQGNIAQEILGYREINKMDLILMGAFGHNWLHDFIMGSVTSKILTHCKQSILFVR